MEDEQLWLQVNGVVPVGDRFRLTAELIERFGDRQNGLFQTEVGTLLAYRPSSAIEFGFGYRRVGAHNDNRVNDEHRIRQHVIVTLGRFLGRLRVDERFNPDGDEIGFRVRPLLRYNHPLGRDGVRLFVSHESFYLPNMTRWGQRRGYERMRNIVGVTLPFGKSASLDLGYLNQFRPARRDARAQMDHALTAQLTLSVGSGPPSPRADD